MGRLAYELRLGIRTFRRAPAFTATVVGILAIGIGMAVAIFTVYDRVLLQRLPVQDQKELVVLWTHRGDPALEVSGSFQELDEQFRPEARALVSIAGVAHWGATPTPFRDGDASLTLNRSLVSGNFFDVLGAQAVVGRLLRKEDEVAGSALSMVISFGTWQRRFGSDTGVVGRTLHDAWSETVFTIVGVAPPGLDYPSGVEVWTPPWSSQLAATAVARLAPGATAGAARDEFFQIQHRLLPDWRLVGATATPFERAVVGDVRPVLGVLSAAVALLLLLTCFNVGNLLLVRATARERELLIRRSLGATLGDVVRQLVLENVALGVAGGMLGLAAAHFLLRLLVRFAPPRFPRLDALQLAELPVGTALVMTCMATALFGILPALSAARSSLTMLRVDARGGSESRVRRRVRQLLVGSQVALALVLLAGAGLLARSLERLTHLDLGYRPEHLAIVQLAWPSAASATPERIPALGEAIVREFAAIPGVTAVSPILIPPFLGANVFHGQVEVDGGPITRGDEALSVPLEIGDVDYFRAFDIPIVRGRGFAPSDVANAPQVAVVSAAVAQRLWPNEDPIGKRIRYWGPDTLTWRTVVGVAGDIRYRALREATATIYLPWRQTTAWQMALAVRTSGELSSVLAPVRRAARMVDPSLQVWSAQSMDAFLDGPLAQPRLSTFLLSGFGTVALLLAAIGLYAVMAAAVRDQTHEIGVRMALGATPARVRREVLAGAIVVVSAGVVVGLASAVVGTRFLASLLYEVSPGDPYALLGACFVLLVVGLAAAYIPARRATRIDPVESLRAE
ncbi:MAG: ADOP family duplicated permease [Gemmatimonadota bacterium]